MGYGRMLNFQAIDSTSMNSYWGQRLGMGYGPGGRSWGTGYGRWNNVRNFNTTTNNVPTVPSRFGGSGRGFYSQRMLYGRIYNLQTEEIIKGKVVRLDNVTSYGRGYYGIHLMVETNDETIPVHLGPAWYLQNQNMDIAVDNEIEIFGSRITFDNKPAIVAAEVKKGEQILALRDETGIPYWSGGWRNW